MTTKLEVLNHMLNTVGENPVSSAASTHPSAVSASVTLNRLNKQMQTRGWWFNSEYGLVLSPDTQTGHVIIPQDTLKCDPVNTSSKLVRRSGKLYDPVNHTYNIGANVICDVVLMLPVEDLPETAAQYLMHRAAYDFYVNDDGDEQKANRLLKNAGEAWAELQQEQLQALDLTAKERPIVAALRLRTLGTGRSNPNVPGGY